MSLMKKCDFMAKYGPKNTPMSESTYYNRMKELKSTPFFNEAYQALTSSEVYIDSELYEEYIKWKSHNRRKGTRYIEPLDWLNGVR